MSHPFVEVYILDIPYHIDKKYVYSIPPHLRDRIKRGSICVVPFGYGNREKSAIAIEFVDEPEYANPDKIKPINDVMDYPITVPDELIELCVFMKERFFCTFGMAMKSVLPPGINISTSTFYSVTTDFLPDNFNEVSGILHNYIKSKKKASEKDILGEFGKESERLLSSLQRHGVIEKHSEVQEYISQKSQKYVRLTIEPDEAEDLVDNQGELTPKQSEVVNLLIIYPLISQEELQRIADVSSSVITALVKKGICERYDYRIERIPYEDTDIESKPGLVCPLTPEQSQAVTTTGELMATNSPKAALLFGVTGSGKTRVIIETVKQALDSGKTAIVLIPEIGLTAQALSTYKAAFGDRLAVIHSMLSIGERLDTYRRITEGKIKVVMGTRSAVFAPLSNIGVIAIDEEQEATYKSDTTPRYHTRDIVRFRCHKNNCLMLLSSATPSIESFYKAKKGVYTLIKLTERYGKTKLPEVIIEDLRNDESVFPDKLIGTRLTLETVQAIERQEQVIMFVNRRGYNSFQSCQSCGTAFSCPHCSVSMTYHAYAKTGRKRGHLSCHYCGFTVEPHKLCPACGSKHIGFFGFGTQKLQDEISERLPDARYIRMDTDTTTAKYSHDKMLDSFGAGESDILFGTQMVAKGLDFPKVSLVGVISVDTMLYMNDFRAGERTFALITQLVGRAGRAKQRGKAVLQTYNPENEILKLAAKQDYEKFYKSEILLRKAVVFPPFSSIAVFGFSGIGETAVVEYANRFSAEFDETHRKTYNQIKIIKYGPYKDGIYKIGGRFRQRIIIKYADNPQTRDFFAHVYSKALTSAPTGIRVDIDVNPSVV